MIPVYICDDEPPVNALLTKIVANQITILAADMGPVQTVDSPQKLLALQDGFPVPAVYFLDIDFPGQMSGLDLAIRLRRRDPRGFIIFITAHGDLAFETFRLRLEALDYIVKSDYQSMSIRVRSCLESIRERLSCAPPGQGRYCTVKILDTVRHIPLEEILFLEAIGHRHTLQLHMDREVLEFNSSLDHFEKELDGAFWRCHRSFLVNRTRIRAVHLKEQTVELDNHAICLLSRREKANYTASMARQ